MMTTVRAEAYLNALPIYTSHHIIYIYYYHIYRDNTTIIHT